MGLVGWNGESEWVRATLSGAVEVDTSELELKKLEASWTRTVFRVKFCGAEERTDEDKDSSYYSGTGQSRTNPTKLKYFADGFKGREIFHEIYFETIQIKYIIHAPLLYTHTDAVR